MIKPTETIISKCITLNLFFRFYFLPVSNYIEIICIVLSTEFGYHIDLINRIYIINIKEHHNK